MRKISPSPSSFFKVIESTEKSQMAEMELDPGQSTGGPNNKHEKSDQWLYVMEGVGKAVVEGKTVSLEKHDLILIESGENHEIKNIGKTPLKTFSIYAPPAY